jgi:hypothetical protein
LIRNDRLRLLCGTGAPRITMSATMVPSSACRVYGRDPLQIVTRRAAHLDQFLAGPFGSVMVAPRAQPGPKSPSIVDHGLGFARVQLRATITMLVTWLRQPFCRTRRDRRQHGVQRPPRGRVLLCGSAEPCLERRR